MVQKTNQHLGNNLQMLPGHKSFEHRSSIIMKKMNLILKSTQVEKKY